MRLLSLPICLVLLAACSGTHARQTNTFAAGEQATVGILTYTVVDSEIQTRLGDDSSPRFPQTRFVIVHLAVSNGGNDSAPIPGLALVDDSGHSYPELADGSGVPHWFGVARKVAPAATERGSVLFDAPAGHYKLKLSEETDPNDVFVDIPLTFVHEQMNDVNSPAAMDPAATPVSPGTKAGKK